MNFETALFLLIGTGIVWYSTVPGTGTSTVRTNCTVSVCTSEYQVHVPGNSTVLVRYRLKAKERVGSYPWTSTRTIVDGPYCFPLLPSIC